MLNPQKNLLVKHDLMTFGVDSPLLHPGDAVTSPQKVDVKCIAEKRHGTSHSVTVTKKTADAKKYLMAECGGKTKKHRKNCMSEHNFMTILGSSRNEDTEIRDPTDQL